MVAQPSGTITLVFTDVEGSTRLLRELGPEPYLDALNEHRRIVRASFARHDGYEVDTDGDAFFYAFVSADGALAAVEETMGRLEATPIRIRVGIHTGEPHLDPPRYFGLDVHKAARIMSAGHGGQVLLSLATRELVGSNTLHDLGDHRLKDFDEPVRLFQVGDRQFPALRTLNQTNLPIPASTFIGRSRELAELTSLLRNPGGRLITLSGPGGSGKTRLAIEAATDVVGDYPDGVFWIGLASLRDPVLVAETIAQTLGAREPLIDHIGSRATLLVLDNFEQVIDAATDIAALLTACRNVRLLITSREILRIQGEVEYTVPPLAHAEAEELFCTRSQLPLDEDIADLCRHLDDLPLAVELAAARTTVLSPKEIRDRLGRRLDLFKGGRDTDPRQRTLRATIDWSCDLLSPGERQLFARLAVFAGGATFDAAVEVVGADVDELQSLVDKSLVRRTGGRFWMLETIAEMAAERLAAEADASKIGRRHADFFLAYAESAEPGLKGADQSAWLGRLEAEHDNLRAGLEWFFEHDEAERAMRLAAALWLFWYTHGHVTEARRWLRRALDAGPDEPSDIRARLLAGAGYLAAEQYDDEAIGLLEAGLACAKAIGAPATAAAAAAQLCGVRAELERGASAGEILAIGEEAVALAREAGDDFILAIALNNLGVATHSLVGDAEQTRSYYEESLELRRRIGDMSRIALSLVNLGWLALLDGDTTRAEALYAEAADIAVTLGDKRNISHARGGLGSVAYFEGRWDDAEEHTWESLRLYREIGMKLGMVEGLLVLAGIAAARGDAERAARLAAAGERHHALIAPATSMDVYPHRPNIERARAACDAETWRRASEAGRAMDLDEAVELALSTAPSGLTLSPGAA
ncbi:MAG TPA: adenylate/guanylate cyclase domain-containing protein [Candidatus Limnocylindrales bacterium]|jgi:predicted ATPase|nr:adenylate/guanylate cyclase domain-containing protein [Candidatus Limnocylindrales bacterium]